MKSNATKISHPVDTYSIMSKARKVIESCTTLTQLRVARKYLKLTLAKLKAEPFSAEENILLNFCRIKSIQLVNQGKKP